MIGDRYQSGPQREQCIGDYQEMFLAKDGLDGNGYNFKKLRHHFSVLGTVVSWKNY